MPISVAQIDLWRSADTETETLEFKTAALQFHTEDLFRYCVAIGNEGGGHLLLGIRNQKPRMVVGSKAIDNPIGMSQKIFEKLRFRVDIEAVDHPDGRVVVVRIPGCPKGSPYNFEGMYLMRVGESVQAMSIERLRRMILDAPPDWLEEPTKMRLGAAQVLNLLDIDVFFKLLNTRPPKLAEDIMGCLSAERLIDEEGGAAYSIRRIAALLLAKDLREFPELTRKAPRVAVYKGATKVTEPTDYKVGGMGYAVGFQKLLRFVVDRIPHREMIENGLRKTVNIIPEIVVRELLANALIHQDLGLTGTSVLIEVFDNRLEVSNPGEPILPLDRLIDLARSRNERLADLMRRLGVCEERGSGIDKVIDAAELLLLPAPSFRASESQTVFVVFGPRGFDELDRDDRVRACYQHCVLKWVASSRMSNQSLRERFSLPETRSGAVTQVITWAIDAQLIRLDERAGPSRKYARYVPFWA